MPSPTALESQQTGGEHHFPLSDPSRPGTPPSSAGAAGAVHHAGAHLLHCFLRPRRPPHSAPDTPGAPGPPRRARDTPPPSAATPESSVPANTKVTRIPSPAWPCAHLSWRRTRRRPTVLGCPPPGPTAPVIAATGRALSPASTLWAPPSYGNNVSSLKPFPPTSHAPSPCRALGLRLQWAGPRR